MHFGGNEPGKFNGTLGFDSVRGFGICLCLCLCDCLSKCIVVHCCFSLFFVIAHLELFLVRDGVSTPYNYNNNNNNNNNNNICYYLYMYI